MINQIRVLTDTEVQSISGGFYNPLPEPEPQPPSFDSPFPLDPVNPPKPDPSWWYGGFNFIPVINPATGPIPEPAKPKGFGG